jgi:DnaJ-class molecular chaperone
MEKDYYKVLGVDRSADSESIKAAYRKEAKRLHPDSSRSPDRLNRQEKTERFLKLEEAYDTLGDKEKRDRYDKSLKSRSAGRRAAPFTEPLRDTPVSDRPFAGFSTGFTETAPFGEAYSMHDQEQLGRGSEDLSLDLILTPQEAERGGLYEVALPGRRSPFDRFHGPNSLFDRLLDRLTGSRSLTLSIPPHTRNGTVFRFPLREVGLPYGELDVTVFVDHQGFPAT